LFKESQDWILYDRAKDHKKPDAQEDKRGKGGTEALKKQGQPLRLDRIKGGHH